MLVSLPLDALPIIYSLFEHSETINHIFLGPLSYARDPLLSPSMSKILVHEGRLRTFLEPKMMNPDFLRPVNSKFSAPSRNTRMALGAGLDVKLRFQRNNLHGF